MKWFYYLPTKWANRWIGFSNFWLHSGVISRLLCHFKGHQIDNARWFDALYGNRKVNDCTRCHEVFYKESHQ